MTKFFTVLSVMIILSSAAAGLAETGDKDSRLSLGVAMAVAPEFEGSKDYEFHVLPVLEYDQGFFFLSTVDGAGLRVLNGPALQAGPLVKYRAGRDQDDSDSLKGMGDVDGGAEAGLFANWQISEPVGLKLEIMHGLGKAKGFTADLGLDYSTGLTENLSLGLGLETRYADSDYNREYFGVSERQSLKSGYKAYNPGGGIKHVAAKASLAYDMTDSLQLGVFGEYKRLTGPAADSPLVKKGSANQFTSGMAFTWSH